MHPDAQTNAAGTEYFVFRAGPYCATIQLSRNPACSPYGVLLALPGDLTRKEGTHLFHPELGLSRTMATVTIDGVRYRPDHDTVEIEWESTDPSEPIVGIRWRAGSLSVHERLFPFRYDSGVLPISRSAPEDFIPALLREVTLTYEGTPEDRLTGTVSIEFGLYPNPYRFHSLPTFDPTAERFIAEGMSDSIAVEVDRPARFFERFITVEDRSDAMIGTPVTLSYSAPMHLTRNPASPTLFLPTPTDTDGSFTSRLLRGLATSLTGLRGAVSAEEGAFDASIWQYGYEWAQDAGIVASAAVYAGDTETAKGVLGNILTRLSDDDGNLMESSRFRDGELSELNANGAVLGAVRDYAVFTGDTVFVRHHWNRIAAIGERVADPDARHSSGLLAGTRDLWERLPWMGLEPGFDTATNAFCADGLAGAATVAEMIGEAETAQRWAEAAEEIHTALMTDLTFSCIEEGRIIHRRLTDGNVQRTMIARAGYHDPRYAPYAPTVVSETEQRPCDPDSVSAIPILLNMIEPDSNVTRATLDYLHHDLWNQTGIGGYLRSPLRSDPDSPGPWPFVTAWMAEAELKAGMIDRAQETTEWMLKVAGSGGSWFEYYGERATPPFPPIGIIVWGWAQFMLLVIRGWMGIELRRSSLRIAPKTVGFRRRFRVADCSVELTVTGNRNATVNDKPAELVDGAMHLPLPLKSNYRISFHD